MKPSDGVEPSTPLLTILDQGGKRGTSGQGDHESPASHKDLTRRDLTRACPRMVRVMFALRSHGTSAPLTTPDRIG